MKHLLLLNKGQYYAGFIDKKCSNCYRKEILTGNVGIKDGKIEVITSKDVLAKEVIDIDNKYLLPGVIDEHVHFNDPGYTWREDFYHGSKAAAKGGVTTVIDMPMQNKPAVITADIFLEKKNY